MTMKAFLRSAPAAVLAAAATASLAGVAPREAQAPVDPASVLYSVDEAVPHQTAAWYFNDVGTAYDVALQAGKPLVLVIGEDDCDWCNRLVNRTLVCRDINQFADGVIFAYSDPRKDALAKDLIDQLEVDAYPWILVMEPSATEIIVKLSMKGFFPAGDLEQTLTRTLMDMGAEPDLGGFGPGLTRKLPAVDGACSG